MSETVRYEGKIQLRPRLENETNKEYFERVTGKKWQKYDWEPECIEEAICDNSISYYEAEENKKGYICINNNIYEFLEIKEKDVSDCYCDLENIGDNTYKFNASYYNGGTDLTEMLQDEFKKGEQ